jgi:CRP-like cAMP-binding protein
VTEPHVRNHILRHLAQSDRPVFDRILAELQPTALHQGMPLSSANDDADVVHFIESGVVSMVGDARNGASVELAIIGREGVIGINDLLGRHITPYRVTVQVPGVAYTVKADVVRDHVFSCRGLHDPLLEYMQSVIVQLTQSVICSRFHTSVQRLARWLLLTAERAERGDLRLTHEMLAQMVGVPRSAVTQAAAQLRTSGTIDYQRGLITIKSLPRLKKQACECYQALSTVGKPPVQFS